MDRRANGGRGRMEGIHRHQRWRVKRQARRGSCRELYQRVIAVARFEPAFSATGWVGYSVRLVVD